MNAVRRAGRRRDRARRLRALGGLPGAARRRRRRGRDDRAHRERRTVPGPDRGRARAGHVDDALKHPTWSMGPKITIDSSTLMNKGLEVIEAHELFGVDFDRIEVVVHPQSVVHGMVEFHDGATIAQLSMPDMRLPDRARPRRARPGSTRPSARSTGRPSGRLTFETARPRRLPVPEPGLCGRSGGRRGPGHTVGSQRGRGRGVPGGPDRLARASPRSSTRCSSTGPGTSMMSPTFWKRTGSRVRPGRDRHRANEQLREGPPRRRRTRRSRPARPSSAISLMLVLAVIALVIVRPSTAVTVAIIVGLILTIMLHEFGHYFAAKRSGMKVTEFFLGFGPRIWSFREGETEYGVKAIPAGGYVRIIGMTNLEEVDPEDEPRTYRQATTGKRLITRARRHHRQPDHRVGAGVRHPRASTDPRRPRRRSTSSRRDPRPRPPGLRPGDRIVAIDGTRDHELGPGRHGHQAEPGQAADLHRRARRRGRRRSSRRRSSSTARPASGSRLRSSAIR